MALVPRFSAKEFEEMCHRKIEDVEDEILRIYQYVGYNAVNTARKMGSYQNITGNLRSSTGWLVAKDGRIIKSSFAPALGAMNKKVSKHVPLTGPEEAESYAKTILDNHPYGLVLIVVAGMEYAAAVESKGYDVLTSAEQIANQQLDNFFNQLAV